MSASVCAALIWKRIVSSPSRHDRECEADGEDALVVQAAHHRADPVRVADHERHDRVRARNRLEAERFEAAPELARAGGEVGEARRPSGLSAISTALTAAAQSAAPSGLV